MTAWTRPTYPETASFQLVTAQFTDLDHHGGDGRAGDRPGPYPPAWHGVAAIGAAGNSAGGHGGVGDTHSPAERVPGERAAGGADRDRWWAAMPLLRSAVANRLHRMSCRHAGQAWERRRKDPLSPYVVAWCFADRPRPGDELPPIGVTGATTREWVVRTAARLWLEADTADGLAVLLYKLTSVTAGVLRDNQDLRTLASWTEDMSGAAWLLGVGVSSLDTPAGRWGEVRRRVDGEPQIPGRCYAHLVDGTRIRVDRFAGDRFGTVDIASTRHLSAGPGDHLSRWRPVEPGELTGASTGRPATPDSAGVPGEADVWQWLAQLCAASTPVQGRYHAHGN